MDLQLSKSMTREAALAYYDQLEPVEESFMIGHWKGWELHTGHPMEGLLQASGWYGKYFATREEVHPLVFASPSGKKFSGKPALLFPMSGLPIPHSIIPLLMQLLKPLVQTRRSKARLRMVEYRGKVSATMLYDELPICDHFRKIDARSVMGVMDSKGQDLPYFFVLEKEQ